MLFRNIRNENVVNSAVGFRIRIMTVVIHPAHGAVPADDAVFHIIHKFFVFLDLTLDGFGYSIIIIRVQHAFECITCKFFELFQVFAAENIQDSAISIQQLFRHLLFINKKAAGHMPSYFFDDMHRFFIQLEAFSEHSHTFPSLHRAGCLRNSLALFASLTPCQVKNKSVSFSYNYNNSIYYTISVA